MHDPVLDEALKRLAAEASTRFSSLVATGDEIPFDVAENNGESSHFYRYVPLTSRFIGAHLEELRSLPSYGPARGAVASSNVAAPYLEARGLPVPSEPNRRAEEMLEIFITGLWEGTTEFSLDISRVEQALASLEVESRDIREADVLMAPLIGFEMTPTEIELCGGVRIVQAGSVSAPLEATTSEGTDRSAWQPVYLATVPLADGEDGPRVATNRLRDLVRALRLYKEGSVGLGPFAFAPIGDQSWRRIQTGAAPPRPGSYFLTEAEVPGLNELVQRLIERPPGTENIAFAQKRFQFGCERDLPVEAVSDHLLAIRSALGGEGVIDAPLAARAAALITGDADDDKARRRVELALDLEQSLINNEDLMTIGGESTTYLAAWIEDSARRILREAVLGNLGANLNVTAEETLITSGLQSGEGSVGQFGSTAEWDAITGSEPDDASDPVHEGDLASGPEPVHGESAEIHLLRPRTGDRVPSGPDPSGPDRPAGPDRDAGTGADPLFGSVPEFEPKPIPEARLKPMPEIEAALGIEPFAEGARPGGDDRSTEGPGSDQALGTAESEVAGTTRLLEPIPEFDEIKVSATTEIGSSLKEDWLSQARPGATMEWPSPNRDRLEDAPRASGRTTPNRDFFPAPETTEWAVAELEYRRKRRA
ncbi:MAG: hypothetical protein KDB62_06290 [Solirubrobacterales bacterium]|nr:hypothetical protein [Solirubrobacterales bacterium]